jgi:hypothetical protein
MLLRVEPQPEPGILR